MSDSDARRDTAAFAARRKAENASDTELIKMLRMYADAAENDGRARTLNAPQWMREAANRLQLWINERPAA